MKVAKRVEFKFVPETSGIEALKNPYGLILWACIKTNHITDQYFNDAVLYVAKRLLLNFPNNFEEFRDLIETSRLCEYCTDWVGTRTGGYKVLDQEFWGGIWDYLTKQAELEIVKPEGAV